MEERVKTITRVKAITRGIEPSELFSSVFEKKFPLFEPYQF